VDIYPRKIPQLAEKLNAVGELSQFRESHGFWLDPVGPETAKLPPGWESRLVEVKSPNTEGAIGWCLEVHDLATSKLLAARKKDLDFVRALLRHGLIRGETLRSRLAGMTLPGDQMARTQQRLAGILAGQ
jgi:uncharacterized nucleotidyltransferase DUF6036